MTTSPDGIDWPTIDRLADQPTALDAAWLEMGLRNDAALIAQLAIEGKQDAIEAHKRTTRYDDRLRAWKALR